MASKAPPVVVNGIRLPSPATLAKYGLTVGMFRVLLEAQDYRCAVCGNKPATGRLVIDHKHVKGWKKMPPEQRRLFVRGLTDWYCNHAYLGRGITLEKARGVVEYLERFETIEPAA
jgi:hypothetical protein